MYHDLPMSYPYRYLAARFEAIDANITSGVTAIKVNIDEGRLILLDLNDNELLDADRRRFPRKNYYEIQGAFQADTQISAYVDYPVPVSMVSSYSEFLVMNLYWAIGETLGLGLYSHDGSVPGGAFSIGVKVAGPNPHSCVTILDGREQALNVAQYTEGKVEYDISGYVIILHTFVQEIVTGALS